MRHKQVKYNYTNTYCRWENTQYKFIVGGIMINKINNRLFNVPKPLPTFEICIHGRAKHVVDFPLAVNTIKGYGWFESV